MKFAHLIIPVISSMIGMAISLLLVLQLSKQRDRGADTKIGMLLGVAVFIMYAGVCGRNFSTSHFRGEANWPVRLCTSLTMAVAPFLPFLMLWSWRVSPVLRWRTQFSQALVAFACASGLAIFSAGIWMGVASSVRNRFLVQLLGLNALICLLPAIASIVRLPLSARLRWFMTLTCSVYMFGAALDTLASFLEPALLTGMSSVSSIVRVLIRLITVLLGLLGSFIVAARFRFVDVFVRWSTRITILGVLSIVGTMSFAVVATDLRACWRGTAFLICAFELIFLLLIGVIMTEKCERWIESHVLQRIDLKAEATRLYSKLFALDSKECLFGLMEEELSRGLELREVRVLPRSIMPDEMLAEATFNGEPIEIPARTGQLNIGALSDIEILVPIPSNGKIEEVIGISVGSGRRSLHSGEIRFLRDVGQQLGVRLHHLETEAASRKQALREALLGQQLTEAELRSLRAQINPHFLFNSLNTIADLIVRNPVDAERMTLRLSNVFRHVLTQADRQFVTLTEEFSFLRNYLGIEQERFGENLQISLELELTVAEVSIPTLLLQPLVENAMKHGLAQKGGKRSLRVVAASLPDGVLLEVIDDGIGFPPAGVHEPFSKETNHRSGVGLLNTRSRLQAVYGEEGRLVIESIPMKGSRVSISLPMREALA